MKHRIMVALVVSSVPFVFVADALARSSWG